MRLWREEANTIVVIVNTYEDNVVCHNGGYLFEFECYCCYKAGYDIGYGDEYVQ